VRRDLVALLAGAIFSAGLCLSGMTHPSKVLAFLDFTGAWDPSLALVMVSAVGVTAVAVRVGARRRAPVLAERFEAPPAGRSVDPRLLTGAAIFGVGWGLSGLCPGPALVAVASGQPGALVFVAAMVVGMALHRSVDPAGAEARLDG
jgi:uncharacterized membrane protein YedE/YeeE